MPRFYRMYPPKKVGLAGDLRPSKLFLAEGSSEAFFLESLFTDRGFDESEYCVFCIEGIDNLRPNLHFLSTEPNFHLVKSMGIMVDANGDADARLTSVLSSLKRYGCADDSTSFNGGNIAVYKGLRIGLFISPGNSEPGTIETLTVREIRDQQESECIEALEGCIKSVCGAVLSEKALTQIYISIKNGSLCGVGRAFQAGILKVEHPAYEEAVETFAQL